LSERENGAPGIMQFENTCQQIVSNKGKTTIRMDGGSLACPERFELPTF
jgi:hypothetical protein